MIYEPLHSTAIIDFQVFESPEKESSSIFTKEIEKENR